jgi:uncharacterized protein (TIGR00251 family)
VAWFSRRDDGLILRVRVVPGARRSEVVEPVGAELKVRVAAPAREGKANDELVRFVAKAFGVPRRSVRIVHGAGSRHKVVEIVGEALDPTRLAPG